MYEIQEICALALGVLAGEKDSHKILADLLEEMGDHTRASWARSRKCGKKKRLDMALGVTPPRCAVTLACDFAEHVSNVEDAKAIADVRSWLRGEASLATMNSSCAALSSALSWEQCYWCSLVEAVRRIQQMELSEQKCHDGKARHYAAQAQNESRKVASLAREKRARETARRSWGKSSSNWRDELSWQIARTQERLQVLLIGESI